MSSCGVSGTSMIFLRRCRTDDLVCPARSSVRIPLVRVGVSHPSVRRGITRTIVADIFAVMNNFGKTYRTRMNKRLNKAVLDGIFQSCIFA